MIQSWKLPHLLKGVGTWLPPLNAWRLRHASTGGADLPRYCYSVWLRHLVMLHQHQFSPQGACIGELGPGDSIGIGLAALLSGARRYIGLDIVPFSAKTDSQKIFDALVQLYSAREPIPGPDEFPRIRPSLNTYGFPHYLIDRTSCLDSIEKIRGELRSGVNSGELVQYRVPWAAAHQIADASLDLVFSQAVLEHVDAVEATYQAMFAWLKPGGYASHVIDFSAHYLSPFWNGHWAYTDWEWHLVRGRREFLLNREPLGTHLTCAKQVGFELLMVKREYDDGGLSTRALVGRFQAFDAEDARTRIALMILRKPAIS
jgi:hypothetical protein